MTTFWWAPVELGVRAKVWLRAVAAAGVAATLAAGTAAAASHPVRPAPMHVGVSHSAGLRHMAARTTEAPASSKTSKERKGVPRKHKPATKSTERAARPQSRSKHHKPRKQDEADNDPVILHRAGTRGGNVKRTAIPARGIAARRVVEEPKPSHGVRVEAPAVAAKTVTSDDFMRAAGIGAQTASSQSAEMFERGESHPDDDERLPMKGVAAAGSQEIVATVSAAPEPVTPAGKHSLPVRGRAKASVLPEDHAGRVAVINAAMTPMILPTLYTRRGRLIVPPPLKGSREILVHQNVMADSEGLDRIQDDEDLDRMRASHLLVPLAGSKSLLVNADLPENRRYARPWAARFASDTAKAFYVRFRQPLRLNSAVRTVEYQIRLQRVNGNAAAVDGDGASPHLTGQALDFGKRGMSRVQIAWMRGYLAPLIKAGKLDVEEEFQQACFHVSVYRSYLPAVHATKAAKMEVAQAGADLPVHAAVPSEPAVR